jgi:hypothetical protein
MKHALQVIRSIPASELPVMFFGGILLAMAVLI